MATPLGMVVVLLFVFAAAIAQFEAQRRQSQVGIVLALGTLLAIWLIVAISASEGVWELLVVLAIAALFAYLLYRLARYKRPPKWRWTPLRMPVLAWLVAVGLALGVAVGLFFCLDERPQHFPRLQAERPPVADKDNGYLVLMDMMAHLPEPGDEQTSLLLAGTAKAFPPGSAEWRQKAQEVLAMHKDILARANEILACPRFVSPLPKTYPEAFGAEPWLVYCRRIAVVMELKARLLAMDGQAHEAMRVSARITKLGRLVMGYPDDVLSYLVANSILSTGLGSIREAAKSPSATQALLASREEGLDVSEDARAGLARALGGELIAQRLMLEAFQTLELHRDSDGAGSDLGWLRKLVRKPGLPTVKVNASLNELGAEYEKVLDGLDHYRPAVPKPSAQTMGAIARRVGYLRFARNFVAVLFMEMMRPAHSRTVECYFTLIADARLTQVFLALRCYQLENGRLPKALDELAPKYFAQVPVDPFTEKPFVYEPDATPSRLFSVGLDQKPDAKEKDDIVVELTFPPNGPEAHR
jgi:multisubunit Na+/H+ antiporter MnhB subunit